MDGLSAAVTVAAIIETSVKIASLCFEYSLAVKDAKKDIDRLQRTVTDNLGVLGGVKLLFEKHDTTRLPTTHNLLSSLEECRHQLQSLKAQLEPRKTQKFMSSLGLRALKWPFTSKRVEEMVASLEKYKQTFLLALEVDQT
jgi:hypothetical protein